MTSTTAAATGLRVRDLMTYQPVTCGTSASMDAVLRAMAEYDCGTLLVVDATGRLAGIIAEDEVCRAMLEFGTGLRQLSVKDIMSPQVFSCSPDDAAGVAREIMRDLHLGRLPVTDKLGRPVGVLWMDALGLSGRSPALRSHAS